ncbi:hypothetical protein L2E82_01136 [Cichorium intybus]|uniref:Uncharacterized protein n=1 Tax=Cichorium intybus TaxID=13427 RepID=A0ACB9GZ71_CICIN|nr:hypothetical protein L2E82_01136 [Cichorium intybus]
MAGHTAIVYSVDAYKSELVVSSSEDRSAKIWKDVKFLEKGDIVTACSDGVAHVCTLHKDLIAATYELEAYASFLSQYKGSKLWNLIFCTHNICRWESGYRITTMAVSADHATFILSIPRRKMMDETQEVLRTSAFPSTCFFKHPCEGCESCLENPSYKTKVHLIYVIVTSDDIFLKASKPPEGWTDFMVWSTPMNKTMAGHLEALGYESDLLRILKRFDCRFDRTIRPLSVRLSSSSQSTPAIQLCLLSPETLPPATVRLCITLKEVGLESVLQA